MSGNLSSFLLVSIVANHVRVGIHLSLQGDRDTSIRPNDIQLTLLFTVGYIVTILRRKMVYRLQSIGLVDRAPGRSAMVTRTAYILISILTLPAFLTSSTFSFGQSERTYNYGHIRYTEGEVTLQRALEP